MKPATYSIQGLLLRICCVMVYFAAVGLACNLLASTAIHYSYLWESEPTLGFFESIVMYIFSVVPYLFEHESSFTVLQWIWILGVGILLAGSRCLLQMLWLFDFSYQASKTLELTMDMGLCFGVLPYFVYYKKRKKDKQKNEKDATSPSNPAPGNNDLSEQVIKPNIGMAKLKYESPTESRSWVGPCVSAVIFFSWTLMVAERAFTYEVTPFAFAFLIPLAYTIYKDRKKRRHSSFPYIRLYGFIWGGVSLVGGMANQMTGAANRSSDSMMTVVYALVLQCVVMVYTWTMRVVSLRMSNRRRFTRWLFLPLTFEVLFYSSMFLTIKETDVVYLLMVCIQCVKSFSINSGLLFELSKVVWRRTVKQDARPSAAPANSVTPLSETDYTVEVSMDALTSPQKPLEAASTQEDLSAPRLTSTAETPPEEQTQFEIRVVYEMWIQSVMAESLTLFPLLAIVFDHWLPGPCFSFGRSVLLADNSVGCVSISSDMGVKQRYMGIIIAKLTTHIMSFALLYHRHLKHYCSWVAVNDAATSQIHLHQPPPRGRSRTNSIQKAAPPRRSTQFRSPSVSNSIILSCSTTEDGDSDSSLPLLPHALSYLWDSKLVFMGILLMIVFYNNRMLEKL